MEEEIPFDFIELDGRPRVPSDLRIDGWDGYLVMPTAGGAGPLNGATFTLDEPMADFPGVDFDLLETVPAKKKIQLGAAAAYTAKVEPGRLIQGRPFIPAPDVHALEGRLLLRRRLEGLLTRAPDGRPLGKLDFDSQTNVWIARDVPEALARVDAEIRRLESGGALPERDGITVTLSVRGVGAAEAVDLLRRESGWEIGLSGSAFPPVAEFRVEKEEIRSALGMLAAAIGAWVDIPEPGRAVLRRDPPRPEGATIEGLAAAVAREHGLDLQLDAECRGPVNQGLWEALKAMNRVAIREPSRIRVGPPDALLHQMEVRVFQMRVDEVALAPARELRWTLDAAGALPGAPAGTLVAIERSGRFVALARVGARGALDVRDLLSVGKPLPGDEARGVDDLRAYLTRLPEATRRDLESLRALRSLRARLEAGR